MASVHIVSLMPLSLEARRRIEAVDASVGLTMAAHWFDGETRQTWFDGE